MLKISMRDGVTAAICRTFAAILSIPVALEVDKLTKDCKSKLYILTGRSEKIIFACIATNSRKLTSWSIGTAQQAYGGQYY